MKIRWLLVTLLLTALPACSTASMDDADPEDIASDAAITEGDSDLPSEEDAEDSCVGDNCASPPRCDEPGGCEFKLVGYVYGDGFAKATANDTILEGTSGIPKFIGTTTDGTLVLRAGLPPQRRTE